MGNASTTPPNSATIRRCVAVPTKRALLVPRWFHQEVNPQLSGFSNSCLRSPVSLVSLSSTLSSLSVLIPVSCFSPLRLPRLPYPLIKLTHLTHFTHFTHFTLLSLGGFDRRLLDSIWAQLNRSSFLSRFCSPTHQPLTALPSSPKF
eukprot:GHVN01011210.1.p1 GENE.GHVN01011210.1~~GHVN01011210.1.p1  ORF type:complete len:147 (-),score=18.21 GHVN01011210.1:892-1332(-)